MKQMKVIIYAIIASMFFMQFGNLEVKADYKNGGQILKQLYCSTEHGLQETKQSIYYFQEFYAEISCLDGFGGCYYDEDERIVIRYSDSPDLFQNQIDFFDLSSEAYLEKCTYSYAELKNIQDAISNYVEDHANQAELDENYKLARLITSTCINEKDNILEVYLDDTSSEATELFQSAGFQNDAIKIFQGAEFEDNTTYIKPGQPVLTVNGSVSTMYSVGFRCRKLTSSGSYIYGFVTAAHGNTINDDVKIGSTNVGVSTSAGDSGGIAYIMSGSNCVMGIVKGADSRGYTYIVKYTEISDALSVSLY